MSKSVESVRLAMTAVADATPGERRQRIVALFDAAVDLQALVARYQDWLIREDAALAGMPVSDDAAYLAREERYIARVLVYQEACDVLSAAYAMVRDDARPPVGKGTPRERGSRLVGVHTGFAGVQAPLGALGEPPF